MAAFEVTTEAYTRFPDESGCRQNPRLFRYCQVHHQPISRASQQAFDGYSLSVMNFNAGAVFTGRLLRRFYWSIDSD